ncbi:MAG: LuxR C-terminal-related transcriptional regulator, partial [Chloroflexi bacterium]|nr:LuxR C-terminal-related transcriptional regulator [Chloroflexota bacterium]
MLFSSEEQETRFAVLKSGASGCLSLGLEVEEFIVALERLANGELLIPPEMAARLLAEFADGVAEIAAEENEDIPSSFARGRINLLQLRIIQLLASGLTNNQVAESLQLSTPVVKQHLQQILA